MTEAAKQVRSDPAASSLAVALALATSEDSSTWVESERPQLAVPSVIRNVIRKLRHRLRIEPLDPTAWSDLALAYASIGQSRQSVDAMRVAIGLAPDSRFILRAAARLLVSTDEPDRALFHLRRTAGLKHDPWLMAAEIAVAETAGLQPQSMKTASRVLRKASQPPLQTSELAAAVATVEVSHGGIRPAKKLFKRALVDPTENALAQVVWATEEASLIEIPPFVHGVSPSEALARQHQATGNWEATTVQAWEWLRTEPYSVDPAILGSFAASMGMQDHEGALEIVEAGLVSNPGDWLLNNNRAFSLASLNRVEEARVSAELARRGASTPRARATIKATLGLIAFRSGDTAHGRCLYETAVDEFERIDEKRSAVLAGLLHAAEEIEASTPARTSVARNAVAAAGGVGGPDVATMVDRLEGQLEKEEGR